MESYSEIKTVKEADKILRALARSISRLKGNTKREGRVFHHDENRYERTTAGDYAKKLQRDKTEVQERKSEIIKEQRSDKRTYHKQNPATGERFEAGRGANRDANIGKGKKPRRVGGGRAAGVGSALGRTPKSLLKNKLMPKT